MGIWKWLKSFWRSCRARKMKITLKGLQFWLNSTVFSKLQMKFFYFLLFTLVLASCSTMHNTSTTIPKNFVEGNEISITGTFARRGINGSLAYSPAKHIYIHGLANYIGDFEGAFHNSLNYGIGTYYNFNNVELEAEFGIGQGKFNWIERMRGGSSGFLGEANGNYKQTYFSISSTFNDLFGVTIRYGNINSKYSYVQPPFNNFYTLGQRYNSTYLGGILFLKKESKFGLTYFATLAIDIYEGDGINPELPVQLGVGLKYNFNFLKKTTTYSKSAL